MKNKVIVACLMTVLLIGGRNTSMATPQYKEMIIDILEGEVDEDTLTRTIHIPNLKEARIKEISNEGIGTLEVDGDDIEVRVTGGTPSRVEDNPSKETQIVRESRTSSSNSFPNTITINHGGISVTLDKDGQSRVKSGSYTPSDSKQIRESQYMTLEESNCYLFNQCSSTKSYNSGGYRGTLTLSEGPPGGGAGTYYWTGTVTKPASDTRVWEQDYEGIKNILGVDNYYSYKVIIEYIDNTNPTTNIQITSGTDGWHNKKNSTHLTINGIVIDIDEGDKLEMYYRINGTEGQPGVKFGDLTSDGKDQEINHKIEIMEQLEDGTHNLHLWTTDDKGGKSPEQIIEFKIDRTSPTVEIKVN